MAVNIGALISATGVNVSAVGNLTNDQLSALLGAAGVPAAGGGSGGAAWLDPSTFSSCDFARDSSCAMGPAVFALILLVGVVVLVGLGSWIGVRVCRHKPPGRLREAREAREEDPADE